MVAIAGHEREHAADETSMKSAKTNRAEQMTDTIGCRLRRDIVWTLCRDDDSMTRTWLAEDPLTRQVFRCGQRDHDLLHWLNDDATYSGIVQRFRETFAPAEIELVDVRSLIARCLQSGILIDSWHNEKSGAASSTRSNEFFSCETIAASHALRFQSSGNNHPNMGFRFVRWMANAIRQTTQFQYSLGSPDRWLGIVSSQFGWLYSGAAVCFWLIFICIAALLVAFQFDSLWIAIPNFQALRSPNVLVGFGVIFVVTRFFHEMGHAIVCKRAGAACKDVGLIGSFGMVCPYVDITDSWRISNRFVRMGIGLAGIYTEAILASIAALVWLGTHPGWVHDCALQVMLVCSITTFLFNANPLMKYDGYFVLCDWLNTQNLRERSFRTLDSLLDGRGNRESTAMSLFLSAYFVASTLNRIFLTCSIVTLVYFLASQWHLTGVGIGLIFIYGCCSAIISIAGWLASDHNTARRDFGLRTVWFGWTAVALLIAWAVNMPLPNRVYARGAYLAGTRLPIYATMPGRIATSIECESSVPVLQNEILLRLSNENIDRNFLEYESRLVKLDQQLKTLERVSYYEDRSALSAPLIQSQRAIVVKQLNQKRDELSRLSVSAPQSGRFEPAMSDHAETLGNPTDFTLGLVHNTDRIPDTYWTGRSSIGRSIDRGALIGWVVCDQISRVECKLSEEQVVGIAIGTEVRIRLMQHPMKAWVGHVIEMAKMTQGVESTETMFYQVRIEFDDDFPESDYYDGNAEVVFVRPGQSLLHMATDQWLRNIKLR